MTSGPDSLDDIQISVLAPREVTQAIPQKTTSEDSVSAPCESQSLDPSTSAAAAVAANSSGSVRLSSVGHGADPPAFTPVCEDSRQPARQWKEREGKEKGRKVDFKFKSDKDSTKKQRKEDFYNKVDTWNQKLACSSELLEVRHWDNTRMEKKFGSLLLKVTNFHFLFEV